MSPDAVRAFLLDGDQIVFNTAARTVKGRWLARDGRAAMCVDEEVAPLGRERAEEYGRRNAVPGELLVRLTPERVIAETGIAD